MAERPVCVVLGVGPGNGESLVRKFAGEGYKVAALARDVGRVEALVGSIDAVSAYSCDATDADQVEEVFGQIADTLGPVDTLLYNAGSGSWGGLMDVSLEQLQRSWEVNVQGLFLTAQAVIPSMVEAGRGTIGVTGATASLRGRPFTTAFAQAKGGQRMLAQSLAREFGPQGIHVFYFVIDGVVDIAATRERMKDQPDEFFLKPDEIAETVYAVAKQPRSAWTFELDLRPFGESW